MTNANSPLDWHDEFVFSSSARARGESSELVAQVRAGSLVAAARGVYRRREFVESEPGLQKQDAFLARVRATSLKWSGELVFAGFAAAAVWGLPIVGAFPERIDVASPPAAGGRSNAALRRSYVPDVADFQLVDGVRVTSVLRTAIDVARWGTFSQGVAVADSALHGSGETRIGRPPVAPSDLATGCRDLGPVPGKRKAMAVAAFADGAAESPGESVSRVGIHMLGFPPPLLQQEFRDYAGRIGIVDFWWPDFNLIGEFDGRGKYFREEYTSGRSPDQVVMDEKRRENRLRATTTRPTVARWEWSAANSLPQLRALLVAAGLPHPIRRR